MLVTNIVTGKSFTASSGLDIVSSALRMRQPISHSCRQGVCGSCIASIQSGTYSVLGCSSTTTINAGDNPRKELLCRVIPHSDISLEHSPAAALERHAAQIFAIDLLADDVARVTLRIISGKSFTFEPGQFIGVRWLGSQLKYFSIASPQAKSGFIDLHIRKQADGGFTQWLFESATTADIIGIDGPIGSFLWSTSTDRQVIMIATGTGFSPIKAIIESHELWNHPGGVNFYWGGRQKADLYQDELACHWSTIGGRFTYHPVISRNAPVEWTGKTGRLPAAVLQDHPDLSNFDVYACGSPQMISDAKDLFVNIGGLRTDRFFADAFESTCRPPRKSVVDIGIEFEQSSVRGRIRAEVGVTLLEALRNNGLNLDHYCGGGAVCATCRINVSADGISTPKENEADLLECLVDLSRGDRLACQLSVTEALQGCYVRLPGRPSLISRFEESS